MKPSDDSRYFTTLAAAFVRGRLPELAQERDDGAVIARGLAAGLRLHKFKRNTDLPRVHRVLGALRGIAPTSLLDVGSGRGTFLWPLLEAFPALPVTAIDKDPRRAEDLGAAARGGIAQLTARRMDAESLEFGDGAFDAVTLLEVLEHMPNPDRALANAVRVARRFVVVTVPSKEDDNPEHIHLFDAKSLRTLFAGAGAPSIHFDYVRGHILAIASLEDGRPHVPPCYLHGGLEDGRPGGQSASGARRRGATSMWCVWCARPIPPARWRGCT